MYRTDCECNEPGWCERHRCTKTAHWHALCRTRIEYQSLWDAGRGPGQRDLPSIEERLGRDERESIGPLHLYFHVWPLAGNGVWQWNVDQLLQRIKLFNGRRVIGIASGPGTDPPEAVTAAFAGHDCEFLVRPNDPALREVATMTPALELLRGEPGSTLVSHAKGVTRDGGRHVGRWTELAWAICTDHPEMVVDRLTRRPIVGPFRKFEGFDRPAPEGWHYHGGFYWVRNEALREREAVPEAVWHGSESFPCRWFAPEEGGVLLFELGPGENLYGPTVEHCWRRYESWRHGRTRSPMSSSTT